MNSKICLSIGGHSYDEVLTHLAKVELAEIRIDLLKLPEEQLVSIFKNHKNLIATFRSPEGNYEIMQSMLALAIESGSAYIDVDINTPDFIIGNLVKIARKNGCKVILSYHNFAETPGINELNGIIAKLFSMGVDIAKVACMANFFADCSRMLGLYEQNKNIVAFCMGEVGKITRLAAPILGAPFTYASIKGSETAPGQMEFEEVASFLKNYYSK